MVDYRNKTDKEIMDLLTERFCPGQKAYDRETRMMEEGIYEPGDADPLRVVIMVGELMGKLLENDH